MFKPINIYVVIYLSYSSKGKMVKRKLSNKNISYVIFLYENMITILFCSLLMVFLIRVTLTSTKHLYQIYLFLSSRIILKRFYAKETNTALNYKIQQISFITSILLWKHVVKVEGISANGDFFSILKCLFMIWTELILTKIIKGL